MRKKLKKNGKNIILGHIAFCLVVFQQISVYLRSDWCPKSDKTIVFFSLKAILLHFFSEKLTPIL